MFRKINIKLLATIFVVLLAIVVLVELVDSKKGGRTFREDLVEVNAEDVTALEIYPKVTGGEMIKLFRENDSWKVESAGKIHTADQSVAGSMIEQLNQAAPESMVARNEDRWEQFEVTDSLGTRVKLYSGEDLLTDLVIGKFSFSQPRKMTSYVRLSGEDEVYGVDGMLGMSFNRNLNSFRDRTVINSNSADWTKLTFSYPADSSFTLQESGEDWMIGDAVADSASVVQYFNSISNLNEGQFSEEESVGSYSHQLVIEGNNQMTRITVKGNERTEEDFLIESSQNPGTIFNSRDLAEKVFTGQSKFLK